MPTGVVVLDAPSSRPFTIKQMTVFAHVGSRRRVMGHAKSDQTTLAELRRSEECLRLALDCGRMGLCEFDESGDVARIDDTVASLLEFPAGTSEIGIAELLSKIH